MKIHELKCESKYFAKIMSGIKTAELRLNDRDYKVGDYLILQNSVNGEISDEMRTPGVVTYGVAPLTVRVTDVLGAKEFSDGLCDDYVMLSFEKAGGHEGRLVREIQTLQK